MSHHISLLELLLHSQGVYQTKEQCPRTTADGQLLFSLICAQDGRHSLTEPCTPSPPPVGMVSSEKDPSYCGASPRRHKHYSRLGITSSGLPAEWILHKEVFNMIQQMLGPARVYLFATRLNHQLPEYISWRPDSFAQGMNVQQLSWKGLDRYAFPPFCLIERYPQQMRQGTVGDLLGFPSGMDTMPARATVAPLL